YDPESAAVIDRITRDEERHVKYAIAISKRYAPDESTRAAVLARYRAAEARAFQEHTSALLAHAVRERLLDARAPERVFWRAIAALGGFSSRFAVPSHAC